jgi:hypothetical protein
VNTPHGEIFGGQSSPIMRYSFLTSLTISLSQEGARALESAFRQGRKAWIADTRSLDVIFNCDFDAMKVSRLESSLFELGWLGTLQMSVKSSRNIALGNVGYMVEEPSRSVVNSYGSRFGPPQNRFVVVANLHSRLTSVDGTTLTWRSTNTGGEEEITTFEHSGKFYTRARWMR